MQEGEFSFPVKYGYCAVGITEEGPASLVGRHVFALHPHQTAFVADASALRPLPEGLPPRRAVLCANMETALNALWDSGAGPGDRIVVVGAGVVGMLTAWLAARLPGADVTLVDVEPARAVIAERLGIAFQNVDDFARRGCAEADAVFHASASAPGLALAIASAGMEGRIIEMSWYGEGAVAAPLGGRVPLEAPAIDLDAGGTGLPLAPPALGLRAAHGEGDGAAARRCARCAAGCRGEL